MPDSRLPSRTEVMELVATISALYTRACALNVHPHADRSLSGAQLDAELARVADILADTRLVLTTITQRVPLELSAEHATASDSGDECATSGMLPTPAMLAWRAIAEACLRGLATLRPHTISAPIVQPERALLRTERARRDVCTVLSRLLDSLIETRSAFAPASSRDASSFAPRSAEPAFAASLPPRQRNVG